MWSLTANSAYAFLLAPCVEGSIELIQSSGSVSTSTSGIIRVCGNYSITPSINHQLICDYGWDFVDATVACKSTGYSPYGAVALLDQYISSDVGYSLLAYVNCSGSKATLNECQSQNWFGSCFYNYAGVICQGSLWNKHGERLCICVVFVNNRFQNGSLSQR